MENFYTDYMIVACKFHFFSFVFLATKEDFKISWLLQRTAECTSQMTAPTRKTSVRMINSLHGIGCLEMMIELLRILLVGKITKVQYQSDA